MPPLTYIANPYSMHVPLWLDAARQCGLQVTIETAEAEGSGTPADVATTWLTPRWVKGPSILRYLWAGVRARLRRRSAGEILHAHCSSGNGLVAWMSGHPYIVTTYGSEVLAASDRGRLYQGLLRRVLQGAERITATSPQMVEMLTDQFAIPAERIHFFDLGLDTHTFAPPTPEQQRRLRTRHGIAADEPVWVAVKRAVPMNRTFEMVEAFLQYCETSASGRLVLLCGNAESAYLEKIWTRLQTSPHRDRVLVVDWWLTPADVAGWLQLADFALSVPTWDQMSNAVLEAMACGAVPILADIGGYRSLRDRGASVRWLAEPSVDSLRNELFATAKLPGNERHRLQQAGVEFIHRHYTDRRVWEVLQRLYNLPVPQPASVGKAA